MALFLLRILSINLKGPCHLIKKFHIWSIWTPWVLKNIRKNHLTFITPLKMPSKLNFPCWTKTWMCQWLQNFIPIYVNGSRFSFLSVSMAPRISSLNNSGPIDANRLRIVEPLHFGPMWSYQHIFVSIKHRKWNFQGILRGGLKDQKNVSMFFSIPRESKCIKFLY